MNGASAKYIYWKQPAPGLHHQLVLIAHGISIGIHTGRCVVLENLKTNQFHNRGKSNNSDVNPKCVLDFVKLKKIVDVKHVDDIDDFQKKLEKARKVKWIDLSAHYDDEVIHVVPSGDLIKHFYKNHRIPECVWETARKTLRTVLDYNADIKSVAHKISGMINGGDHDTMHVRGTPHFSKEHVGKDNTNPMHNTPQSNPRYHSDMIRELLTGRHVFIATDIQENREEIFGWMKDFCKVYFISDFKDHIPDHYLQNNYMLCPVEEEILRVGKKFISNTNLSIPRHTDVMRFYFGKDKIDKNIYSLVADIYVGLFKADPYIKPNPTILYDSVPNEFFPRLCMKGTSTDAEFDPSWMTNWGMKT